MVSFLSDEGFDLLLSSDADSALDYIANEAISIDGLLTDVHLGAGATGWDVARSARLRSPGLPVIYTSSVGRDEWRENAVPSSRLCTKPFRPSQVVEALLALMKPTVDRGLPVQSPSAAPSPREELAINRPWVVGPLGQKLYKKNLPSPTGQWTSRRKAEVVAAFAGGLLSGSEVQELYGLSVEEFAGWQRAVERYGISGLKQTRIQHYRELQRRTQNFGWAG